MSAAKRKNREQDLEPTERDYDGGGTNTNGNADGERGAGDAGGCATEKGGGGGGSKKRRRDAAPAQGSGSRGEDLDRLKQGFLGGSKGGGAGVARAAVVGAVSSSAEDFVQPKKKKAPKGPSLQTKSTVR